MRPGPVPGADPAGGPVRRRLVGQVLIYWEQGKRYPNAIRYYTGTQTITEMPEVCKAADLPDVS
jgi:hypothetical protein